MKVEPAGAWNGSKMTETVEVGDDTFYYWTVDDLESVNMILIGDGQTPDITGITADVFYEYDGGSNAKLLDNVVVTPQPTVSFSPNGGTFEDTVNVTVTAKNATSATYQIGTGSKKTFSSTASFTLGADMEEGESVTVAWTATNGTDTREGTVTFTKKQPLVFGDNVVYFHNSANWGQVYCYSWTEAGGNVEHLGAWPGTQMTETVEMNGKTWYVIEIPGASVGSSVIFNNGGSSQTRNLEFVAGGSYDNNGPTSVDTLTDEEAEVEYYTLQGVRVSEPKSGIYVRRQGSKVSKVIVR